MIAARHAAEEFLASTSFPWHQRFELAPGVFTPGVSSVAFLLDEAGIPADLHGRRVLDVGTSNGGCAFELERRGAERVVAVDLYPATRFGFTATADLLGSRAEFVCASVYELPERLGGETFDLVLFFGVLYHLRHPLLALDRLREVANGDVFVESAVCDHEHRALPGRPYVRFYRERELAGDPSNWFAPTHRALEDWMRSAGFEIVRSSAWPAAAPTRAMVAAVPTPGPPEYQTLSYERPLTSVRVKPLF